MTSLTTPRYHFRTVTSTNDFAREGIVKGVPEGSLYSTDHQTKGRGRRGATWSDAVGQSALISIVLYPKLPADQSWLLSFAASLAACEALQDLGVRAMIKWPNDLMVDGTKVGGVLVEMAATPDGRSAAVVGIGINVAQEGFHNSEGYALPPTSLRIAMGANHPDKEQVIDEVARRLSIRYDDCAGALSDPSSRRQMLSAWREHLITDQPQSGLCLQTGRSVEGILRDVRLSDGAAQIELSDGTTLYARPAG